MKISLLTHRAKALESLPIARTCLVNGQMQCLHRVHGEECAMASATMGHLDLNPQLWFYTGQSTELLSNRCLVPTVTSLEHLLCLGLQLGPSSDTSLSLGLYIILEEILNYRLHTCHCFNQGIDSRIPCPQSLKAEL